MVLRIPTLRISGQGRESRRVCLRLPERAWSMRWSRAKRCDLRSSRPIASYRSRDLRSLRALRVHRSTSSPRSRPITGLTCRASWPRAGASRVRVHDSRRCWNERDLEHPFSAAYEAIITAYDSSGGSLDLERRSGRVGRDLEGAGWQSVRVLSFAHLQPLAWEGLIGFTRSASYLPREGAAHEALRAELQVLYERSSRSGLPAFRWVTRAYLADRHE
jgi:hypothetical protein